MLEREQEVSRCGSSLMLYIEAEADNVPDKQPIDAVLLQGATAGQVALRGTPVG